MLHVDLTPRPVPFRAGTQPPNSGLHFSHHRAAEPMLLHFPAEILQIVLGLLEPIWLFQVAAAYPQIDSLLGFEKSNKIWYNATPAALFLEPENFQDEMLVEDRMSAYSTRNEPDATLQLSYVSVVHVSTKQLQLIDGRNKPFSDDAFFYNALHSSRFVVPAITNLSELSRNLDFSFDIVHPQDRRFYPTTPTRVRVMALGGPFQPWLDYRQELAGHLHYGVRCFICFEVAGRYRQYRQYWGMIWCSTCYDLYMLGMASSTCQIIHIEANLLLLRVGAHRVAKIPGLDMLVKHCSHYSAVLITEKPGNRLYRPMVDEILRQKIGIDFHTAAAVQTYIGQLLETWKGGTQSEPLKAHRRNLRRDIVRHAQHIWDSTVLDKKKQNEMTVGSVGERRVRMKLIIVHARQRWAPTSRLAQFLFPARLLPNSNLWLPYDSKAQWLPDPTLDLETSRDVLRAGPYWIDEKAKKMVRDLVVYGQEGGVTSWMAAAQEWHIQRLTHEVYCGKYLNLKFGGPQQHEPMDVPTAENNRLDVLAKKLRIDPVFPVGVLTKHEKKRAIASFNKIIFSRCTGCPLNNLLILPSGLKGIVQHYCEHHPSRFYTDDRWTIRG